MVADKFAIVEVAYSTGKKVEMRFLILRDEGRSRVMDGTYENPITEVRR